MILGGEFIVKYFILHGRPSVNNIKCVTAHCGYLSTKSCNKIKHQDFLDWKKMYNASIEIEGIFGFSRRGIIDAW